MGGYPSTTRIRHRPVVAHPDDTITPTALFADGTADGRDALPLALRFGRAAALVAIAASPVLVAVLWQSDAPTDTVQSEPAPEMPLESIGVGPTNAAIGAEPGRAIGQDRPAEPVTSIEPLRQPETLSGAARVGTPASRVLLPTVDLGDACIEQVDADHLDRFLSQPWGIFEGADYQRSFDLGFGRVLWVFQDAFLDGRLVHNAAMLQQGRCFTLLNDGTSNWLFDDRTEPQSTWWWILDGNHVPDRREVELVVAEMVETGGSYLSKTRVARTVVVTVDDITLDVVSVSSTFDQNPDITSTTESGRFYGWSIVDHTDDGYRYLYSHCYAQFGFDNLFGAGCSADMHLARVAGTSILGQREYWNGAGWSTDPDAAAPVVDGSLAFSGNNPGAVMYDNGTERFRLVVAVDDWWSNRVVFAESAEPQGPWTVTGVEEVAPRCADCNSYYAAWGPRAEDGTLIWTVGHNHWNIGHTQWYFPSAHPYQF